MTYSDFRELKIKKLPLIERAYMRLFANDKKAMKKEYFEDFLRMQNYENEWRREWSLKVAEVENIGIWKKENYGGVAVAN